MFIASLSRLHPLLLYLNFIESIVRYFLKFGILPKLDMVEKICKGCPTHVVDPTVSRSSAIASHFTCMSHTVHVLSLETDGLYWFVPYVQLISVRVDTLTSSGQTDNVLVIIGSKFAKPGTDLREFCQKEL